MPPKTESVSLGADPGLCTWGKAMSPKPFPRRGRYANLAVTLDRAAGRMAPRFGCCQIGGAGKPRKPDIPRIKLLRQESFHATLAGFGMDSSFYWSVLILVVQHIPAQS